MERTFQKQQHKKNLGKAPLEMKKTKFNFPQKTVKTSSFFKLQKKLRFFCKAICSLQAKTQSSGVFKIIKK